MPAAGRGSGNGELVLLADQDRSRWNLAQIEAGAGSARPRPRAGGRGPYVIQAAIAALHTEDPRDWEQIVALYDELTRATDSPVVALARAVAVAETRGPAVALELIEQIDLKDYRYLDSTRAELLRRLGRSDEAIAAYRSALALTRDEAERRLLARRLTDLDRAGQESRPRAADRSAS